MKGLLFSSITPSFIYMTGYKEVTEVCTTPFIYLDGSMYEVLIRSLKQTDMWGEEGGKVKIFLCFFRHFGPSPL